MGPRHLRVPARSVRAGTLASAPSEHRALAEVAARTGTTVHAVATTLVQTGALPGSASAATGEDDR